MRFYSHCNSGHANAPQCCVVRILPVLFLYTYEFRQTDMLARLVVIVSSLTHLTHNRLLCLSVYRPALTVCTACYEVKIYALLTQRVLKHCV